MLLTGLLRSYNEEDNIELCLDCLLLFCDQVVISDGGSTDRTWERTLVYGDRVVWLDYPGGSMGNAGHWNHTADQLNFALPHCKGDWIILQDVDQVYCERVQAHLREELEKTTADAYVMYCIHMLNDEDHFIKEVGVGPTTIRLWRHRPELRFKGAIHSSHMSHVQWKNLRTYRGARFHYGCMTAEMERAKAVERHKAVPSDDVYKRIVAEPPIRTPALIPWWRCDPDCITCWMEDR